MDVTVSSILHEKRIHRRRLHEQDRINRFHVIFVSGKGEETLGEDLSILPTQLKSFSVSLSFETLLHPKWLNLLPEHQITAHYDEPYGRFTVQLRHCQLVLECSKEMYEKLGIEGEKLDRTGRRFRITLDLQDPKLTKPGHKWRSRLLENTGQVIRSPLEMNCTCSESLYLTISSTLTSLGASVIPLERVSLSHTTQSSNMPEITITQGKIPDGIDLEEWNLWLGAITTNANMLQSNIKVDPFISTCRIPDGPTCEISHWTFQSQGVIPSTFIAEFAELTLSKIPGWTLVAMVGTNASAQGFAMYITPALDYCFCSNS